jgi:Ribose/xylose/arabinose/galactoside ABC-type transport systems, permease components
MENLKIGNKPKVGSFIAEYGIIIVLIGLCAVFSFLAPNFFAGDTLINILRQVAVVGICAVGMTMILISGGIDLSVGSVIGIGVVLGALFMKSGMESYQAVIVTLLLATGCGLANAFFICKLNLPPFIATLGMMTSLRGVCYIVTGGLPVYGFSQTYSSFAQTFWGPVPVMVVLLAAVCIVGFIFLRYTKYGRYIYGVGCNEEATRLSGISVKKIKYMVYGIGGFLAGLAGLVLLARISTGEPAAGTGYEMNIITACVLGGASLSGGEGNIGFVVVGVLIMGVLNTGLVMMSVDNYVQQLIQGLVLISAVAMDMAVKKRKQLQV